jgi:hypothetical protein
MTAESRKSGRHGAGKSTPCRRMARLEDDPRFLKRIEKARKSLRAGRGVRLKNVK